MSVPSTNRIEEGGNVPSTAVVGSNHSKVAPQISSISQVAHRALSHLWIGITFVTDMGLTILRIGVPVKCAEIARRVILIVVEFCGSSAHLINGAHVLRLANFISVPFALVNMGTHVKDLIYGENRDRVDAGLALIGEAANTLDLCGALASAMGGLGLISHAAAAWAWTPPMTVVWAILASADGVLAGLGWYQSNNFRNELDLIYNQRSGVALEIRYTAFLLKQDNKTISKHLRMGESEFKTYIQNLNKNPAESKSKIESLHKTLMNRVSTKITDNKLQILHLLIIFVAVGVLFSPVPVVGLALLIGATCISLGTAWYNSHQSNKFKNALLQLTEPPKLAMSRTALLPSSP